MCIRDRDKALRDFAAKQLTSLANEWLADNDQTDRNPEKDPITEDAVSYTHLDVYKRQGFCTMITSILLILSGIYLYNRK